MIVVRATRPRDGGKHRARGRPPKPITPEKSALSRLGRALRQVREAADWSLTAFSEESGFSQGHLSRVEHGEATPSRELVNSYDQCFRTDGLLGSLYETVLDAQAAARRATRAGSSGGGAERSSTAPGDCSQFVEDLSFPDGTLVSPRARFEKRWLLRNAGTVRWRGRMLERIGSTAGPGLLSSPHRVPIADTRPGETAEVAVSLQAPEHEGTTIAYWQMVDADGHECFPDRYADGMYCVVVVRDDAPLPR